MTSETYPALVAHCGLLGTSGIAKCGKIADAQAVGLPGSGESRRRFTGPIPVTEVAHDYVTPKFLLGRRIGISRLRGQLSWGHEWGKEEGSYCCARC